MKEKLGRGEEACLWVSLRLFLEKDEKLLKKEGKGKGAFGYATEIEDLKWLILKINRVFGINQWTLRGFIENLEKIEEYLDPEDALSLIEQVNKEFEKDLEEIKKTN